MAVAVVWSHSFALYLGSEETEPLSIVLDGAYNAGNIGVMVFFVISGFLVTRSFLNSKSIFRFMKRRVTRIYPGYMVATSICAFIIIPIYAHIMKMDTLEVVKTIGENLLLRNYFPPSNVFNANHAPQAVNGSLWSIPFEFWCYIGVAALGAISLLSRRWFLVLVTVTVLFGRVVLDLLGKKPGGGLIGFVIGWPYEWFVILPNFLFGMLAFSFRDVIPKSRSLLLVLFAAVLISSYVSLNLAHLIMPLGLAYATFYLAFTHAVPFQNAGRWGDFSYGTYLYAWPIQQMLFASFIGVMPFVAFVPLAISLSLTAGVISWYAVERWFLVGAKAHRPLGRVASTTNPAVELGQL
jgi:peptidoglycan/LPS O-acetylase OafA/YrhL